jgi:hypothetical protein
MDLVSGELVGYCWYPIDVENCKWALSWWCKKKNKFPTNALIIRHILGIPTNQIEIERIFLIAVILTTLCWCYFQIDNMDKFIFIHKNWPPNPWVGYLKSIDYALACEVGSIMGISIHAFCVSLNWNPCLCESMCVCMNLFTCIWV